jgi:hypothetical protein
MRKILLTFLMAIIQIIKFPFMVLTAIFGLAVAVPGFSNIIPLLATMVTVIVMIINGINDVFNGGGVIAAIIYGAINIGLVGGVAAFGFVIWASVTSAMIKFFRTAETMTNFIERFLGRGITYCQRMRVFN